MKSSLFLGAIEPMNELLCQMKQAGYRWDKEQKTPKPEINIWETSEQEDQESWKMTDQTQTNTLVMNKKRPGSIYRLLL